MVSDTIVNIVIALRLQNLDWISDRGREFVRQHAQTGKFAELYLMALPYSSPPVCLSVCNLTTVYWIYVKFDVGDITVNFIDKIFGSNWTTIIDTLHKNQQALL